MAPLSAAIGCNQLKHLKEHNSIRNGNLEYLSHNLEELGFHTFLPPTHIQRVYFEFIIRYDETKFPLSHEVLVESLQLEGCEVTAPRYPLLHQQPFFTEGIFKEILRLPANTHLPSYGDISLPVTETINTKLLKLPSFPRQDNGILDQYLHAFTKVMTHIDDISKLAGKTTV